MKNFINNKQQTIGRSTKKRLYRDYKNIIKSNKVILKDKHNLEIDWINRLWKVYSVPIEERYNIYQYGNKYLNELVKKDLANIDKSLMSLGLLEIVGITNLDLIDDFNVKVVLSYKYYNLVKRMNNRIYFWSSLTLLSILSIIFFL